MGPDPPLKNLKHTRFLSDTGPHPLKNHRAIEPAFNVVPTSADDGPFIVVSGSFLLSSTKNKNVKVGPFLANLSGSVNVRHGYETT